MTPGYAKAREEAIQTQWRELSWFQRRRSNVDALRATYDSQHLLILRRLRRGTTSQPGIRRPCIRSMR